MAARPVPCLATMPRYTWTTAGGSGPVDSGKQFNVCRHCKSDPVMLNTVVARLLDLPLDGTPKVDFRSVRHQSFDFLPAPVPCAACGRLLDAEDD